jgi:hypothetical protein
MLAARDSTLPGCKRSFPELLLEDIRKPLELIGSPGNLSTEKWWVRIHDPSRSERDSHNRCVLNCLVGERALLNVCACYDGLPNVRGVGTIRTDATIGCSVLRMMDMIASPLARERGRLSETLPIRVAHKITSKAEVGPRGRRIPCAFSRRPVSGPKRKRSPTGKFDGTLVQVHSILHCQAAWGCLEVALSLARSLSLSLSGQCCCPPSLCLSVFPRWRVRMPCGRSFRSFAEREMCLGGRIYCNACNCHVLLLKSAR